MKSNEWVLTIVEGVVIGALIILGFVLMNTLSKIPEPTLITETIVEKEIIYIPVKT